MRFAQAGVRKRVDMLGIPRRHSMAFSMLFSATVDFLGFGMKLGMRPPMAVHK